jgi:hypothetical protein
MEKWSDGVMEKWSSGVMEFWSFGVLELRHTRSPPLPFSITPVLHHSRDTDINNSPFS